MHRFTFASARPRAEEPTGPTRRLAGAAACGVFLSLFAFCPIARAVIVPYTNQTTFLAALEPSPFVENFSGLNPNDSFVTGTFAGPGGSGPYSFTISADGGLLVLSSGTYGGGNWLSTGAARELIAITITGTTVTGFGGFPFLTDFSGNPVTSGSVRLTLNGTASYTLLDPSPTDFFGVVSSDPITSVTLEYLGLPEGDIFVTAGPITMGVAVPEPGTLALAGCGLVGAAALGMRRQRQRGRGDAAAGRRPPADFGRGAGGSTKASSASPV
jgi:hypothetical protein